MTTLHARFLALMLAATPSLLPAPSAHAQEAMRVTSIPQAEIVALTQEGPSLFAASYTQVYTSDDGGTTWSPAAPLPPGADDLSALLVHEHVLYAGTIGSGVFTSRDAGASWAPLDTGLTGLARRVTTFALRGDSLYAGTDGAGVHVLNLQQPDRWTSFNQGLSAQGIVALSANGGTLVAGGGPSGSVYVRPARATSWTAVPLDAENTQNQVLDFLSTPPFLLAGTAAGVYRSSGEAEAWFPIETSLPDGGDVVALTAYGARLFAAVVHQGIALYSSDDYGGHWTLRHRDAMPVFDLLGSHDRLWVGRADGLWYYDLTITPRLFHASLMRQLQGQPVGPGSVFATLEGTDLQMVGFFRVTAPWHSVNLYHGDPRAGGELVKNLYFTVPEGGGYSDGLMASITLTEDQVQELLDGQLYLHVGTLGSAENDLSGPIRILPLEQPLLLETSFSHLWGGSLTTRGTVRAALEGDALRLIGFGRFEVPVGQVALYRGAPGEPAEHLASLWINYTGDPTTTAGFDHTLPLSSALRQDLLDGRLYLEIQTMTTDSRARGRLFLASNEAPAASQITAPASEETIVIGGTDGGDPMDPETILTEVTFTTADDPDGTPVGYIWQLSRSADFAAGVTAALDLGPAVTTVPLTVSAAAALFDTTWTGSPSLPLHTPVTVHHRVITTDGARHTYGPPATLTLLRGTITPTEPRDETPDRFVLHGNYPNPFNPVTTITFDLPATADVRVDVFNLLGQHVLTVPAATITAGVARTVQIDGSALPSGAYLYRVVVPGADGLQPATGRMVLLK